MVGPLWSHHYFQNYHENLRLMKSHQKDLEILSAFIHLYCQGKHSLQKEGVPKLSPQAPAGEGLCTNCDKLLTYASMRLAACPFDPKPRCSACKVHCYREPERSTIRKIMRYSGPRALLQGRFDYLWHHFFGRKKEKENP